MKRIFIFFVGIACSFATMRAQVTVGALDEPEKGALLEIKTDDGKKGLLAPKVVLVAYNSLEPLYNNASSSETAKATGMIVYNVNPGAVGVRTGIVEWNGEKWVAPGEKTNQAVFTINPDGIVANGFYNKDKVLLPFYNTLSVAVTVTIPGTYTLQMLAVEGVDSNAPAGFSFFAKGEFSTTGNFVITLHGDGKPKKSYTEIGGKNDALIPVINGQKETIRTTENGTNGIVRIDGTEAGFSFGCFSIKNLIGNLTVGAIYSKSSGKTLLLDIYSSEVGGEYVIESDEINGIKLWGNGLLEGNTQTIPIYAIGKPNAVGEFTFILRTNSSNSTAMCEVNIKVTN